MNDADAAAIAGGGVVATVVPGAGVQSRFEKGARPVPARWCDPVARCRGIDATQRLMGAGRANRSKDANA